MHIGCYYLVMDYLSPVGPGVEHPDAEDNFQGEVARDEGEHCPKHTIEGSQKSKHDPIGEPFFLLGHIFSLDGLSRVTLTLKDM